MSRPDPGGRLLTGVEAAAILGITPRTAALWARTGRLAAYKIGGTWRYPEPAVRQRALQRGGRKRW